MPRKLISLVLGLAFGVLGAAGAGAQQQVLDPIGIWEPDNRESRYEFSYCGENGDRLCAKLIWIQEDKKDARNTKYLDTYMLRDARQTRYGHWSGTVTLEGFNFGGTVTQSSPDVMNLKGGALFVICEDIRLNRVR